QRRQGMVDRRPPRLGDFARDGADRLGQAQGHPLHQSRVVTTEVEMMKARIKDRVIAASDDIVEEGGYAYFPNAHVRLEWLERAEKTASDLECPHGVQFYDVVIDGKRHERAAWQYERPRPEMAQVRDRFSFWQD